MKKKKVLIVNDQLQFGGSDLVAVRLQQNIDSEKFECVYCVRKDEKGPLEDMLSATGVRIIHQPDNRLSYFQSYKYYLELFNNEHFDIVHSHLLFFSGIVLLAAKKKGIKKRVAHSHFSQPLISDDSKLKIIVGKIYRVVMRVILGYACTDMIACSQKSGEFLYGKKNFKKRGIILNNGIDCQKFEFDAQKRDLVRSELKISKETTLIGHVGMLYYIKNQDYVIDIFKEYQKKHNDSKLILIGSDEKVGETVEKERLIKKCSDYGILDKVIFTGNRSDVNELMMAMDCFVFPSIHEGFPLTLVEAQATKLPCLISDTVSQQTKLNSNVEYLSIELPVGEWVKEIERLINQKREKIDNSNVIKEFDIKEIANKLGYIYLA